MRAPAINACDERMLFAMVLAQNPGGMKTPNEPTHPALAPAWQRHHGKLAAALSLSVFLLALIALRHVLAELSYDDVTAAIGALKLHQVLLSVLGVYASYALLVPFDWVGVHLTGKRVPLHSVALTSFIANAFGHSLGMAPLTGGAVRARGYGARGLDAVDVGQVVACATLGFALGALLWLGLAFTLETDYAELALHLPARLLQIFGIALLLLVAAVVLLSARGVEALQIRHRRIALPRFGDTLILLTTSAAELSCAALALYALLPDSLTLGFLSFTGLYLIAICAGLISTVPAGLGVFEATLIVLLPDVPASTLLGAIVVYRALYYLTPLLLALTLLALREVLRKIRPPRPA